MYLVDSLTDHGDGRPHGCGTCFRCNMDDECCHGVALRLSIGYGARYSDWRTLLLHAGISDGHSSIVELALGYGASFLGCDEV